MPLRRNQDDASATLDLSDIDLDPPPEQPVIVPVSQRRTPDPAVSRARVNGLAGVCMLILVVAGLGLPLPGGHLAADAVFVVVGFQLGLGVIRLGGSPRWLRRFWLSAIGPVVVPSVVAITLATTYWLWLDRLGDAEVRGVLASLMFLTNVTPMVANAQFPATDHLWLISLIVQFALLAPLVTRVARHQDGRQPMLRLVIALVAAVTVIRLTMALTGLAEPSTLAQLTITRLDGLLVGLGVAIAPPAQIRRISTPTARLALVSLVAVFILAPEPSQHPVISLGLLLPVAIAATAIVVASCTTAADDRMYRAIAGLGPRWLGERAISIYIWHQLFGLALTDEGGNGVLGAEWPGFGLFITGLVFALAAGAASYRYLQLPIRTELERLLGRRGRSTTTRPPDTNSPPALSPS